VLTGWIAGDRCPTVLSLGDECELRDPVDHGADREGASARAAGDEIGKHLEAGKQVTRLALTLDDHVSFVLGEDLVVRKFQAARRRRRPARIHRTATTCAPNSMRVFALMSGEASDCSRCSRRR
jgi:DNA recombination-dependent growth factor C